MALQVHHLGVFDDHVLDDLVDVGELVARRSTFQ